MKPLIDCDILLYEIGIQGQYTNDEGEVVMLPFSQVAEKFDDKIQEICADVWATEEPTLFISHNKMIFKNQEENKAKQLNKINKRIERAKKKGDDELVKDLQEDVAENQPETYNPNFRESTAKKKVYKGNRSKNEKPKHYMNLVEYALSKYDCVVAKGLEADDLLGIYQLRAEPNTTIICSRDKDLKIIPGMHYGWEVGNQRSFGPEKVEPLGYLKMSKNGKKLSGVGLKFFYSQILTGDVTDNYPGLPRTGPVKAFKLLNLATTEGELFEAVLGAYRDCYGEDHDYRAEMLEQARLAWMIQEVDEDDNPVQWQMYDER